MSDRLTEDGTYATPSILMARTSATEVEFFQMDSLSRALITMSMEHHEVHEGHAFAAHYSQAVSDTNDRSIIAFKTGAITKEVHLIFAASSSAPATAYILEAPTITDDTGAPLTIFNRKRTGGAVSTVIDTSQSPDVVGQAMFFTEITMGSVTAGTTLDTIPLVAGAGPKAIGGVSRGTQEWILKADTLYAFVVNSSDDDDNIHRLQLDWYEHTAR